MVAETRIEELKFSVGWKTCVDIVLLQRFQYSINELEIEILILKILVFKTNS